MLHLTQLMIRRVEVALHGFESSDELCFSVFGTLSRSWSSWEFSVCSSIKCTHSDPAVHNHPLFGTLSVELLGTVHCCMFCLRAEGLQIACSSDANYFLSPEFHNWSFVIGGSGAGLCGGASPLPPLGSILVLHVLWMQSVIFSSAGLQVSFFEIYAGKLYDLLNGRQKLCPREDGKQNVCVVGLTEHEVQDTESMMTLIEFGNSMRASGIASVLLWQCC